MHATDYLYTRIADDRKIGRSTYITRQARELCGFVASGVLLSQLIGKISRCHAHKTAAYSVQRQAAALSSPRRTPTHQAYNDSAQTLSFDEVTWDAEASGRTRSND